MGKGSNRDGDGVLAIEPEMGMDLGKLAMWVG